MADPSDEPFLDRPFGNSFDRFPDFGHRLLDGGQAGLKLVIRKAAGENPDPARILKDSAIKFPLRRGQPPDQTLRDAEPDEGVSRQDGFAVPVAACVGMPPEIGFPQLDHFRGVEDEIAAERLDGMPEGFRIGATTV